LAELPFVRRPTGGLTLVHDREVTYALAVADDAREPALSWLERVHRVIAAALADLGVWTELAGEDNAPAEETSLCFRHVTRGDLLIGPHKVVGSAQRRQRGALLQHGAILLDTSLHTPSLPGIEPLTGRRITASEFGSRFEVALRKTLGWELARGDWAAGEREKVETLADEKYRSPRWNERR
jgi:lipoate-protein ligase A